MAIDRAGQLLTAAEIFDLVREDLQRVEKAIDAEAVASVETVTTIGKYLQQSGGKSSSQIRRQRLPAAAKQTTKI